MKTGAATVLMLACALLALAWATDGFRVLTSEQGRRLWVKETQPRVPDVTLALENGQRRSLRAFLADGEGPVLVTYFYSRCPTVCLALAGDLRRLRQHIAAHAQERGIRLLSISFDPDHDQPEALRRYGDVVGADGAIWRLATVTDPRQLALLLDQFGIRVLDDGHGGYLHNSAFHLVGNDGRLLDIHDVTEPGLALRRALRESDS